MKHIACEASHDVEQNDIEGRARAMSQASRRVDALREALERERRPNGFEFASSADERERENEEVKALARALEVEAGELESWGSRTVDDAARALTVAACRALANAGEAKENGKGWKDLGRNSAYCPPHARNGQSTSDEETPEASVRCAAARALGALAKANGKALHGSWSAIFPTSMNQLSLRSASASIVKTIVCDSSAQARCAAASAAAAALEGPASAQYLAMATYSGSPDSVRSFSSLSTTLGAMVVTTLRAFLSALANEQNAACVRELCKAIGALCDAAPFSKMRLPLLREAIECVYAKTLCLEDENVNERTMVRNALFGALSAVLSAKGGTALDEYLQQNASSIVTTMIAHARGDGGSKCEAYNVLRALVAHHIEFVTPLVNDLRELFPSAVCVSGADDRLCQASARLLTDYLGAASRSQHVREGEEFDLLSFVPPPALPLEQLRDAWADAIATQLPVCAAHKSPLVRVAGIGALNRINLNVIECFENDMLTLDDALLMPLAVLTHGKESVPAVRAAACSVLGATAYLPSTDLELVATALLLAAQDKSKSVQIPTSWSLANVAEANVSRLQLDADTVTKLARTFIQSATDQGDKVRANAARGIGHLITFCSFDASDGWLLDGSHALASCLTTGNAKTQWNACLAIASLLSNESAMEHSKAWSTYILRMLLLLIRDARNFKIRVHASAALGACQKREHFGMAYSDALVVVASSLNALLNPNAVIESQSAIDFKYKSELVQSLTMTYRCIVSLANADDSARMAQTLAPFDFLDVQVHENVQVN